MNHSDTSGQGCLDLVRTIKAMDSVSLAYVIGWLGRDAVAGAVAEAEQAISIFAAAAEPADHPFARPGQVAPDRPAPDACMVCGQPEAAHPAAEDDAGRSVCGWQSGDYVHYAHAGCPGAELDAQLTTRMCGQERIGYGACEREPVHPGWHRNMTGEEWPQYAQDRDLDAMLTGPGYRMPAIELTGGSDAR